ncbi:MAG: hypothetical protein IEMM0008_0851 [bacterium]|nr:MAG: hypothetical protein IEMM0008_0851 [bacterium]
MEGFKELIDIISTLRGPDGCQWDKDQTLDSVKPYLLEETYEVLESITNQDFEELKEELGDMLCQVVFIAQLADEDQHFTMFDVLKGISEKLIRRHPHVFGDVKTKDTKVILKNWELIKSKEKKDRESLLDGIPKILPGLAKAYKTQDKASRAGFDWDNVTGAFEKVEEELGELKDAVQQIKENREIEEELGDLLFSVVNVARFLSVEPEFALHKAIDKFSSRFRYMEKRLKSQGLSIEKSSSEEMNRLWDESKKVQSIDV